SAVPSSASAQLWLDPLDIVENLKPPATGPGTRLLSSVRSPSWPLVLSPQQYASWPGVSAHVCANPGAIRDHARSLCRRIGALVLVTAPEVSTSASTPQHHASPPDLSAQ